MWQLNLKHIVNSIVNNMVDASKVNWMKISKKGDYPTPRCGIPYILHTYIYTCIHIYIKHIYIYIYIYIISHSRALTYIPYYLSLPIYLTTFPSSISLSLQVQL